MKEILLTKGMVALVDDEDFDLINQHKWHVTDNGYAVRRPYIGGGRKGQKCKTVRMHRVIMGDPVGMDIDHINGNRLDNRRENLRICTRTQNLLNKARKSDSSSKYRGVYWNKAGKKWAAQISIKQRQNFIGFFESEEAAALAYNKAALELHGKYAQINEVAS